jgi:hypothetical protein
MTYFTSFRRHFLYRVGQSNFPLIQKTMKKNNNKIRNKPLYNSTIFTEVYKKNLWGGKKGEFYSGTGSHNPQIQGYAKMVSEFIQKNDIINIIEIGCGDFNVSRSIISLLDDGKYMYSYHGYDVVKPLTERNKALFGSPKVKFTCKDSSTGNIASGDLLIIRQVLQHLNNKSIKKIVEKFKNYTFILVSEHQVSQKYGDVIIPNKDKKTDAANRIQFRSGVYLDKEPFNCIIDSLAYVIQEPLFGFEAYINTFLLYGNPTSHGHFIK